MLPSLVFVKSNEAVMYVANGRACTYYPCGEKVYDPNMTHEQHMKGLLG